MSSHVLSLVAFLVMRDANSLQNSLQNFLDFLQAKDWINEKQSLMLRVMYGSEFKELGYAIDTTGDNGKGYDLRLKSELIGLRSVILK